MKCYPSTASSGRRDALEARILAVADVVAPTSSYHPYLPALGVDTALKEISDGSGKRYYPEVVAACLKLFKEKGFTFSG